MGDSASCGVRLHPVNVQAEVNRTPLHPYGQVDELHVAKERSVSHYTQNGQAGALPQTRTRCGSHLAIHNGPYSQRRGSPSDNHHVGSDQPPSKMREGKLDVEDDEDESDEELEEEEELLLLEIEHAKAERIGSAGSYRTGRRTPREASAYKEHPGEEHWKGGRSRVAGSSKRQRSPLNMKERVNLVYGTKKPKTVVDVRERGDLTVPGGATTTVDDWLEKVTTRDHQKVVSVPKESLFAAPRRNKSSTSVDRITTETEEDPQEIAEPDDLLEEDEEDAEEDNNPDEDTDDDGTITKVAATTVSTASRDRIVLNR
ncbi:hypothetical protein HKX48_008588 [Thoreauomyces humboldtii]|nr:hypothetical protein HKX48_008588 [Thoreauomyces humboldtii]